MKAGRWELPRAVPADVAERFLHIGPGPSRGGARTVPITLPPHLYPPAGVGVQPFQGFGDANVAGPADWIVPAGAQLNVSASSVAVVQTVGIAVRNLLATSAISIVLRVGRAPMAPTYRVPAQPVAYIEREWDVPPYVIGANAVIDVLINVADAGVYDVTGYFGGYFMPGSVYAELAGY